MTPFTEDLTAGERARRIHQHPEAPQRLPDPMDRRCGEFVPGASQRGGDLTLIVDPTDPLCGHLRD